MTPRPATAASALLTAAVLIALALAGAAGTASPDGNGTEPDPEPLPEVFRLPDGRTVAAGTTDEIAAWIEAEAICHVDSIAQLDVRDSLLRWRSIDPGGARSCAVRAAHDGEQYLHYATIEPQIQKTKP